ncbi:hypothetical protein [Plebeiibacterium sediminum]|uniref:Lipoprotein n=1 Tax=Plebeiibacterium sediminum TaxID=2992112 RepID=A0AAE3M8B2_9BACT|nr:hypothetical protein [Plebeiobacterium sediminum]MCW3788709.1 hypothetical protein [Plebeiobacterium sediminum]
MKNLILSVLFAILLIACVSRSSKKEEDKSCCAEAKQTTACCSEAAASADVAISDSAIVTVDQLLSNPEMYIDKKIELQGFVMHTCKKTGKKMFLKGTDESTFIRIEAGENISKFEPTLEGETVIASGVLSVFIQDSEEHAEGEACSSEDKAKGYVMACESFKQI